MNQHDFLSFRRYLAYFFGILPNKMIFASLESFEESTNFIISRIESNIFRIGGMERI
jgi:hypothetical protein